MRPGIFPPRHTMSVALSTIAASTASSNEKPVMTDLPYFSLGCDLTLLSLT
jgi:hypothetical protein